MNYHLLIAMIEFLLPQTLDDQDDHLYRRNKQVSYLMEMRNTKYAAHSEAPANIDKKCNYGTFKLLPGSRMEELAMEQVHWNDAVIIEIADGITQTVRTVADAENILLSQWNRFELDSLGAAIKACLLCSHDIASTEDARLAFERAASTSGILV
ncbi:MULTISPECIES: DUF982 domain-containing protein [unclassified Ochrobactrum]|uniref:DUF982 domain-containing protein n=1 Tax=unclassified Ochrobactrum TaxID=239106 RepID=UPI0025705490|nr:MULTISPECIES: DUF982 domain-containing protein [unclassified Ochrobactrum]